MMIFPLSKGVCCRSPKGGRRERGLPGRQHAALVPAGLLQVAAWRLRLRALLVRIIHLNVRLAAVPGVPRGLHVQPGVHRLR